MNIYELKLDDDGETVECDACGLVLPVREMLGGTGSPETTHDFCELCATTFIGMSVQYPDSFTSEGKKVLQTIGHVTNLILTEMKWSEERVQRQLTQIEDRIKLIEGNN